MSLSVLAIRFQIFGPQRRQDLLSPSRRIRSIAKLSDGRCPCVIAMHFPIVTDVVFEMCRMISTVIMVQEGYYLLMSKAFNFEGAIDLPKLRKIVAVNASFVYICCPESGEPFFANHSPIQVHKLMLIPKQRRHIGVGSWEYLRVGR